MDLKLKQLSDTRVHQDITYSVESGLYITDTLTALVELLKEEAEKNGLDLISFKPFEMTVRRYFEPQTPQGQEEVLVD